MKYDPFESNAPLSVFLDSALFGHVRNGWLTEAEAITYAVLQHYAAGDGFIIFTYAQLSKKRGKTARAVRSHVATLERRTLLEPMPAREIDHGAVGFSIRSTCRMVHRQSEARDE